MTNTIAAPSDVTAGLSASETTTSGVVSPGVRRKTPGFPPPTAATYSSRSPDHCSRSTLTRARCTTSFPIRRRAIANPDVHERVPPGGDEAAAIAGHADADVIVRIVGQPRCRAAGMRQSEQLPGRPSCAAR